MFGVLFSKEIREHLMTFRFGAALISTFILIVVSAWVLGDDFNTRQTAYNRLSEHYKTELEGAKVISHVFPKIHRPPTVLSIFSLGENPHLGNVVEVRRWSVPRNATGSLSDNQFLSAYPTFDLLSIFTLVISLFGILFTYDTFSGERVNGTLKVICSYKVSRSSIFFAKFSAGVVALAIPFIFSLLSSLLVLQFMHNISFSGMEWLALLAIVFAGLLYGAIFIGIGILSSSLFRNSSSSLVLALLIWSLGVFLIPLAANNIATTLQPLASEVEIDKFLEETNQAIEDKKNEERVKWRRDYPGDMSFNECSIGGELNYCADGSYDGMNYLSEMVVFDEANYQDRADRVWALVESHNRLKSKQREMNFLFAFVAPSNHLRQAVTALSGTHLEGYKNFLKSVRKYRSQMLNNMEQKGLFSKNNVIKLYSRLENDMVDSPGKFERRMAAIEAKRERNANYEADFFAGPLNLNFLPQPPSGSEESDFETAINPIAVLMIMLMILLLSSYFVFVKYDVR